MKSFTDIFIKRPVLAMTVSLLILLLGIMSYQKLSLRLFPKLNASEITIQTIYAGANAKLMEGFVSTPIENAISGVDGIDYITSSSTQNLSTVSVYLKLDSDVDQAMNQIANKVSAIRSQLPADIQPPVVDKKDPDAFPIMWLSFTSNNKDLSQEQVTDYLTRVAQPEIQALPGVSSAEIIGGRTYAMRIWLDPHLMAARNVTALDVANALQANNVQSAAGQLKGKYLFLNVYSDTDLQSADQFNNLVVREVNNRPVRIKDIGKAVLGAEDTDFSVWLNDKDTIMLGIHPKPTANPLDVAKEVKNALPNIEKTLPAGVNATISWDSSQYIHESINEVMHTILEAAIFVFLVIFFMIGSFRAVFVPIITIPLSLIGSLTLMNILGFSINILTLLAFVLSIGLVVDDAIVVLENIYRHIDSGKSAFDAAIIGAREIAMPVIAMSLTLAAVYAPIGFMEGLTGKLFTEFAFTLAGSVILSGIIALTLSPMMCAKFYSGITDHSTGLSSIVDKIFHKIKDVYRALLTFNLRIRWVIVFFAILIYAACYFLFMFTPQELAPTEDQGVIMTMAMAPIGSNLDYLEQHTRKITKIFSQVPDATSFFVVNGYPQTNNAFAILNLKPWNERKTSAITINDSLFPKLFSIPGILAFPIMPPSMPGASGFKPIEIVLKTTGDYDILIKTADKLMAAMRKKMFFINLDSDLKVDQPQANVEIDRGKAANLGIPMSEVASSLNIFLGKPTISRFNMEGRRYDVLPQLFDQFRNEPNDLNNIYVRTASNNLVPLSNIAVITQTVVPESLNHFQQLRSDTISSSLPSVVPMSYAIKTVQDLIKQIVPKNIQVDYDGQTRQYLQNSGAMLNTFIFALIFIYLILAAQFESFVDPFIVLLSVPLSIAGALFIIFLFHATLNIYTEIGLVTLIGLISKHGILIVNFANKERERGISKKEAIINAASIRLRPILMTTFAILLGALPLALASGAGAQSRIQLGLVILGGMSFGTLFTLFVLPVAYYILATKVKVKNVETTASE